jgi:Domain of unknown function (DUF4258)
MPARIIPFPCAPSAKFLEEKLKEFGADSEKLIFDNPHFKERLVERGLSMRHALEAIRSGCVVDGPQQDKWGNWRIKVSRLVAGRRVQVVVAYKGDHFVVVTVI